MTRVAASRRWRRLRRALTAMVAVAGLFVGIHVVIRTTTGVAAPAIQLPPTAGQRGWTRVRAGLREVYLEGTPEAMGAEHARLLRDRMLADEGELWAEYEHFVPWWIARVGIEDYSRLTYRNVDRGVPPPRLRELAAEALAFAPDPFAGRMPTYQRMLFLYSLYDIALPLEHSPLIGCTSFAVGPAGTLDGHVLAARAFDFEAGEIFDRDKAVFLVRGDGVIPFASVAWPGFVGVVTGMNAEGLVVTVHGGRAGESRATGIPVAFSLREVLERAHDTEEAIAVLAAQSVMVSHMVFLADAEGRFAVVERAPGMDSYVRRGDGTLALTNHFEGPLAGDAKNGRVRATTTTLARRQRIDAILAATTPRSVTPQRMLDVLRDHQCAGDAACPLGDRRAIDALIATHGIVADATDRVLWVSAGPGLSGKFVRLDLRTLLAPDHDPATDGEPKTMAEDPILDDGRWAGGRAHAGGPRFGGDAP